MPGSFFVFAQRVICLISWYFFSLQNAEKPDKIGLFGQNVAVLGGFVYHFVNEAKSQYILVYFLMLIPYAAWGIDAAVHGRLWGRLENRLPGRKAKT